MPFRLVLGSASPRRRAILESLGLPHEVLAVEIDESPAAGEGARVYLERMARAKLDAVRAAVAQSAQGGHRGLLLVADTSVLDGDAILGKPASEAEGQAMVERLGGRTHEVATRFALGWSDVEGNIARAETVVTRVTFRPLVPGEAARYAATGEGRDKAGGYAVQGMGAGFVARIEGSYSNVVGLPACEVVTALVSLGLRWP